MSTLGERIKEFRKNSHLTQVDLGKRVHLSAQVISNYERGYSTPSAEDVRQIADALNVEISDLYAKTNSSLKKSRNYYDLTDKDRQDIGNEIDRVLNGLDSKDEVNFYGEPMSDEDKEKMRMAMQTALEIAKREAKKKFTPKKYRDDNTNA